MNKSIIMVLAVITVLLSGVLVVSLMMRSAKTTQPVTRAVSVPVITNTAVQPVAPSSPDVNTSVEVTNNDVNTSVQIVK